MTTEEGNKLIAEFMGGEIVGTEEYEMPHGSHSKGVMEFWKFPSGVMGNDIGNFKYHTSWDWLMPVVEKVEDLDGLSVEIEGGYCAVRDDRNNILIQNTGNTLSKIQSVRETLILFIQLYNQNKQS